MKKNNKNSKLDRFIDSFFERVDGTSRKLNSHNCGENKLLSPVAPNQQKNKLNNIDESSVTSDSIFSHKEDGDLFFFDVSGNRKNGTLVTSPSCKNKPKHTYSDEKNTIVDMVDSDLEITYLGKHNKQKRNKCSSSFSEIEFKEPSEQIPRRKHKRKHRNSDNNESISVAEPSGESVSSLPIEKKKRKLDRDSPELRKESPKKRKLDTDIKVVSKEKKRKDKGVVNEDQDCSIIDISASSEMKDSSAKDIIEKTDISNTIEKKNKTKYNGVSKNCESIVMNIEKSSKMHKKSAQNGDIFGTASDNEMPYKKRISEPEKIDFVDDISNFFGEIFEEKVKPKKVKQRSPENKQSEPGIYSTNLISNIVRKKKKKREELVSNNSINSSLEVIEATQEVNKEGKKKKKKKIKGETRECDTEAVEEVEFVSQEDFQNINSSVEIRKANGENFPDKCNGNISRKKRKKKLNEGIEFQDSQNSISDSPFQINEVYNETEHVNTNDTPISKTKKKRKKMKIDILSDGENSQNNQILNSSLDIKDLFEDSNNEVVNQNSGEGLKNQFQKKQHKIRIPQTSTPITAKGINNSGNIVMELFKKRKHKQEKIDLNDVSFDDLIKSILGNTEINNMDVNDSTEKTLKKKKKKREKGEKSPKISDICKEESIENIESEDFLNESKVISEEYGERVQGNKKSKNINDKYERIEDSYDGDASLNLEESQTTTKKSKKKKRKKMTGNENNDSTLQSETEIKISKKKRKNGDETIPDIKFEQLMNGQNETKKNKKRKNSIHWSDNEQFTDTENAIQKIISSEKERSKLNVDDIFSDDHNTFEGKKNRKVRTSSLMTGEDSESEKEFNTINDESVYEDLTERELDVLRNLIVTLPFERIPPLHQINRPSKPTLDDMNRAKIFNTKLGAFSKEEDAIIIRNWEQFCKDHDLNVRPAVFFKFKRVIGMKEKTKFLQYLSHGLDDRLPFRVHFRFRKLFEKGKLKKGRFTPEEDRQILNFLGTTQSSKHYHDLGILLNRTSQSVEKRYELLTSDKNLTPIRWTLHMSERLITSMLEIAGKDIVKDLEHLTFNEEEWKALSKIMDNIPVKKLQRAWKVTIHPRLFMKEDLHDVKMRLINLMIENKESDLRIVNWEKLSQHFQGMSGRKLQDIFRIMIATVPQDLREDLKCVLEYLSNHQVKRKRTQIRYKFKGGRLKYRSTKNKEK